MSAKNHPDAPKTDAANSAPAESADRRKRRNATRTTSRSARNISAPSRPAPSKGASAPVQNESVELPAGGQKPTVAPAGDQVTVSTDDEKSMVIPFTAWRPGAAIEAAVRQQTVTVNLPVVGPVTLPSGPHMAWYAGVATLAVLEVVEWPIAILMVTAKALSDSSHHQLLSQFGDALEQGS